MHHREQAGLLDENVALAPHFVTLRREVEGLAHMARLIQRRALP